MRRHDVSVKIAAIDFKDAENHLLALKNSTDMELQCNYKSAFQGDMPSKDDGYKYLLINIDGTLEAIARVKFPNSFSSLARLILKCNAKAPGWLYAKHVIEEILVPECRDKKVPVIFANTADSRGGRKTFEDLKVHLNECKFIKEIGWTWPCHMIHLDFTLN